MSSWVSHLPPEKQYKRVVGHGMNAQELQKNPRLDTYFVRNLNKEPRGWALEEQSIDAVLCCVRYEHHPGSTCQVVSVAHGISACNYDRLWHACKLQATKQREERCRQVLLA